MLVHGGDVGEVLPLFETWTSTSGYWVEWSARLDPGEVVAPAGSGVSSAGDPGGVLSREVINSAPPHARTNRKG